jgi:hypothetical protein
LWVLCQNVRRILFLFLRRICIFFLSVRLWLNLSLRVILLMRLDHSVCKKFDKSLLQESFFLFQTFSVVISQCFHFFEHFSHQIIIKTGNLLQKRSGCKEILLRIRWDILGVDVIRRIMLCIILRLGRIRWIWIIFYRWWWISGVLIGMNGNLRIRVSLKGLFIFEYIIFLRWIFCLILSI